MSVDQEARDLINDILAEFATRWDGGTWGVPADYSVLVRQDQPPDSGASQFKGEDATMAAQTLLVREAADIVGKKISALTEEGSPAAGDWLLGERSEGELRKFDVGDLPFPAPDHTHDDRYYTEAETDAAIDADVATHAALGDAHHNESHTVASHSDTTATGAELETLTDTSDADALHTHSHGNLTGAGADDHHDKVHTHADAGEGGTIDHGALDGKGDDDHTQYLLADGSRELTGNMTVADTKTIDGRNLSVDGAKLDGIEPGADVTDATNVNIAGAVMHTEVDDTPVDGETDVPVSSNWAYDHDADGDAHHNESHAIESHPDTDATAAELETLTDGSDAGDLHVHDSDYYTEAETDAAIDADVATHAALANVHHPQSHTVASHSDTTATGAELETLTDGSDADALHIHDARYFTEAEHLDASTGAGDAGKPVKLDADGHIDATMINDGDVSHDSIADVSADDHHNESHTVASHDTGATGAELDTLTDTSDADALHTHSHGNLTGDGKDDHHNEDHAARHTDGNDDIQDATDSQKGLATAAQITKLDAIEAAADVTDAANVNAAGAVMHSDVSEGEGFLRKTGAETYVAVKSNLAAAVAPTADEDSGDGYAVGSIWLDTTNDKAYVCVDATVAAAVWLETSKLGDVVGPGSATEDGLALYDGATGKLLKSTSDLVYDGDGLAIAAGDLILSSSGDIRGASSKVIVGLTHVGAAVNYVQIHNSATENNVKIEASGSDANIGLEVTPKGDGALVLDGLQWPTADGTADQLLKTNGSGVLAFADLPAKYRKKQCLWRLQTPEVGENWPAIYVPDGITLVKAVYQCVAGTSVVFNVEERGTDSFTAGTNIWTSDKTASAGAQASTADFDNAGIAADSWLVLDVSAVNGSVTDFVLALIGTID